MKEIETLPRLRARDPGGHKGDYGHVLVIGGSQGMAGAPCLCGKAALRGGAGLVTVAVPEKLYPIVATKLTCCMTRPLAQGTGGGIADRDLDKLAAPGQRFDVVALGPGVGRAAETFAAMRELAARVQRPMVIDADALNALAGDLSPLQEASHPRVLTPHPGEMARLAGLPSAREVSGDRIGVASGLAARTGTVVVLKGRGTVVTDGERYCVNTTGNPGMATGGTGDVLTGLVAALIAQGLDPFEGAQLGVYLHGLAGDLAAERLGQVSLIASDLLDELPRAFLAYTTSR